MRINPFVDFVFVRVCVSGFLYVMYVFVLREKAVVEIFIHTVHATMGSGLRNFLQLQIRALRTTCTHAN